MSDAPEVPSVSEVVSHESPAQDASRSRLGLSLSLIASLLIVVIWFSSGPRLRPMTLELAAAADEPKSAQDKSEKTEPSAKKEKSKESGDKKSAKKAKTEDEPAEAPEPKGLENPFPRRLKLSGDELSGGVEWLNSSGEITMKDLRGKIVLVDFWTYCCINCMHILPDLKFLEEKYPKELVVIGVHSAKFDNEKDTENIRRAVMRYEIEHPIVNDANMAIWRGFGVRAWPTLVLLDPEGYYCGYISGEGNREPLDAVIAKLIEYHKAKGTLDETPVRFDLEQQRAKPGALRFPGKVLADETSNRLFITDSNHNRIVITTLEGKLLETIGNGRAGSQNGDFQTASFFRPQGTALVGDKLYVSDTENHLLRVVDLKSKKVTTLAGTGEQARFRAEGGALLKTALNSPWAITVVGETMYVAMAGPHQLWSHKLGSNEIGVFAGSGREDVINGPFKESAFAQPSGMSSDGKSLFVADSEGSSIRKVALGSKGEVTTIAGTFELPQGQSLFAFGDVDDVGEKARFQHPLDVLFHDGAVFVADSYNHKIKRVELDGNAVTTVLGTGKAGTKLSPPQLSEPAGLTAAKGKLFIADTNNHRICVVDLKSGEMTELKIEGLQPPPKPKDVDTPTDSKAVNALSAQSISGDRLVFEVRFKLPEGYKLNKLAKVTYKLEATGDQDLIAADQLKARKGADSKEDVAVISIPLAKPTGEAKLTLAVSYSYCRDGVGGLCKIATSRWSVPVNATGKGEAAAIKLEAAAE